MQQEQASPVSGAILGAIVDKLILAAIFGFIVALGSYTVYAAFGAAFPIVKMTTSALTSFLLVVVAIPLIARYANMIFLYIKLEQSNAKSQTEGLNGALAVGSGIVCLMLGFGVVNSVVYANALGASQDFLILVEVLTLGFQLRRILLHK